MHDTNANDEYKALLKNLLLHPLPLSDGFAILQLSHLDYEQVNLLGIDLS